MTNVIFRVRRPFKYAGVQYRAGDEFIPQGSRNDDTLISRFCWTERRPDHRKVKGNMEDDKHGKQYKSAE